MPILDLHCLVNSGSMLELILYRSTYKDIIEKILKTFN